MDSTETAGDPSDIAYTFPWERMPYEIRDQIFASMAWDSYNHYFFIVSCYFKWSGCMPALVVTLRSLPAFYQHVLKWFSKHNKELYFDGSSAYGLGT